MDVRRVDLQCPFMLAIIASNDHFATFLLILIDMSMNHCHNDANTGMASWVLHINVGQNEKYSSLYVSCPAHQDSGGLKLVMHY